jgi:hypothetical protein
VRFLDAKDFYGVALIPILTRPLGGRHAAVIPALPEEQGTIPPNQEAKDHRRASVSDKEEPPSPSHQQRTSTQQQFQSGLTTIVLPPPTTSDTLNIQEYQPPPKDADKRMTRGRAAARGAESPTPGGPQRSPSMRTRGGSRNELAEKSVQPPPQSSTRSPYLVTLPSPPAVPATFASIMNAYPAPDLSSRPGSGNSAHRTGSRSASNAESQGAE